MAYISQDQNQQEDSSSTNVLAPTSTSQTQVSQPATTNTSSVSTTTSQAPSYVSNGNPYGKYTAPNSGASSSTRKSTSGPSSGLQTNVQTYAQKNQASSQKLGSAVAGKLQTTSDIAKQNLANIENKYNQSMEAGSIANRQNAVNEATNAFKEASTIAGPTRTFKENKATLYNPTKTAEGTYSTEDQALVDANKARVTYGDGSTKEFATAADAQNEIDTYNKSNPGYYTYGDQAQLSTSNDRLSEILNAEYKGPRDLNEISGYNTTYDKIQDASQLQNQALKSGSKEELLNRTFAAPTGEYSKGNRTLDDLLLGQGEAANILKTTAEKLGSTPTGKIQDEFMARTKQARQSAIQRNTEMEGIKSEARRVLSETANTRTDEVNSRIDEVLNNWESYPQYFRDRFQKELDAQGVKVNLNQEFKNLESKYGSLDQASSKQQELTNTLNQAQAFNYDQLQGTRQELQKIAPWLQDMADEEFFRTGNLTDTKQMLARSGLNDSGLLDQYGSTLNQYSSLRNQTADNTLYGTGQFGDIASEQGRAGLFVNPQEYLAGISQQELNKAGISGDRASLMQNYANLPQGTKDRINQAFDQYNKNALSNYTSGLSTQISDLGTGISRMGEINTQGAGSQFDPNAMNLGLSQLEAEALGIKGGEGLYNILKEQGIEGLIKTATADRNKLISTDEQSQLARLQSIAQLAKDYGTEGSGVNVVNPFADRDLAGTQNTTSALDIDNFRNLVQGAERDFRTDASGSNIVGQGYGTGSSGGAFSTKRAQSWKTLEQNLGDLIESNNGYRNMYSDQGVNKDLLKKIINSAQGGETFNAGYVNPDIVGTAQGVGALPQDLLQNLLGDKNVATTAATNYAMFTNPVTAPLALANMFGNFVGGSSAEAQGRADLAAQQNALADLQSNVANKINTSGLKNQFTVGKNTAQDLELFKLLGLLDTTNL